MKIDKNMRETAIEATIPGLRDMSKLIMDSSNDFQAQALGLMMTLSADLIQDLHEENAELRAQLIAFQKAANPAVAVDLASGPDTTACYTPFVTGTRVCLKAHPYQRGTIVNTRFDDRRGYLISVRFDSEFEDNRWVKARNLELIPDE
ncbi:hypothetical protein CDW99_004901 [Salmonella enterica subsp. enterica serovar Ealing]|nr:hypothetical protein [Salmonella enterica subsp. enterica serovar Dahomey]EDU1332065.1 hypothetical protein [Salmonella enterica subsp. enterica serovar Braenderup]EDX6360996.1 hypothetical protein [Salmonella enterica subsp. enterica serovar Ealing]EHW1576390.1 hypothetical protein [Salmonella enterica]EJE2188542.1 hypothetical protein [Salmonella enterica]